MLSLVGIGGAGCRIVESFYRKDFLGSLIGKLAKAKGEVRGVAIDTSDSITSLKAIPSQNKVLIGKSTCKGHGTGGDIELGKRVLQEEAGLAMNAVRRANITKPDMFFLVVGLGGGTGTGGLPIMAGRLKATYDVPVVGIMVFPSKTEGTLYVKNAYKSFNELTNFVDGTIVLDNNVLSDRGEDIPRIHKTINQAIFNFLNNVEPEEILRICRGKISTPSFLRVRAENISVKDILDRMLKDHVYFPLGNVDGVHLVVNGDMKSVYGQNFAREWVKGRFGVDLNLLLREDPNSKYLNIGLLLTGFKDAASRFEAGEGEKSVPSELEDLFGDIKPLF